MFLTAFIDRDGVKRRIYTDDAEEAAALVSSRLGLTDDQFRKFLRTQQLFVSGALVAVTVRVVSDEEKAQRKHQKRQGALFAS